MQIIAAKSLKIVWKPENWISFLIPHILIYRVFINLCNEALAYHFGQMATYDLGHVVKVSYI